MQTLITAFLASFLSTLLLLRLNRWHLRFSADQTTGVQKFHGGVVPRIGGIGVALGLGLALVWSGWRRLVGIEAAALYLAMLPAFFAGLAEDITKRIGVIARLVLTGAAAALGAWLLDAQISRVDLPGLDLLLLWKPASLLLTLFAVTGVTNSINIIDGFNGLAAAVAMLMFIAFGYVSWVLNDAFLVQICLAMIGALLGFFLWNYPHGLIFLGDSGAYLVGFILAEVAVLLVARHNELSPWFCLLVCSYPITETLFSIYRKGWVRGISPTLPDGLHLHMLIYRRIVRWAVGSKAARDIQARNAATSPYLWGLASLSITPAVLFWHSKPLLIISALLFFAAYLCLYWKIIRFRTPRWLRWHKE